MAIRLLLIDDQTLVRQGIRGLLELSDRVEVAAEGSDGDQAVELARAHSPDVILMDMRMPRIDGAEATRALADAGIEVPVIILTTFDDHHQVLAGIQAGARGYLLKDVSLESLIEAIESVATGKTMIQPGVTESLLRGLTGRTLPDAAAPPERLTPRETEILRLMAGGYSNREIATALSRSEGTIKNQVSSILGKLGVRDRTRAVLKAIEMGLLADAT
ncbi:MAG TPA: response regulator transcription factor [Woeseiaceae bacterium]|nr:response regulator transcription factor [Woeseiaceae bacterium]